ncbi:hypothetical protein EVAR_95161_1 [Eumeta japonica]|uniref:Uncharacterized protein n=1 Tax=Eumeta variegata TaxID=151549 RepID=A0A4C1VGJ5_EUMVA|nr:hypothetical protein EVAR_95161_1 [Eumeta japonica]
MGECTNGRRTEWMGARIARVLDGEIDRRTDERTDERRTAGPATGIRIGASTGQPENQSLFRRTGNTAGWRHKVANDTDDRRCDGTRSATRRYVNDRSPGSRIYLCRQTNSCNNCYIRRRSRGAPVQGHAHPPRWSCYNLRSIIFIDGKVSRIVYEGSLRSVITARLRHSQRKAGGTTVVVDYDRRCLSELRDRYYKAATGSVWKPWLDDEPCCYGVSVM